MEDLKTYLESGILELYVLGQLDTQSQAEVEAMVLKYPILKEELLSIETAMEKFAQQHAIQPSKAVEDKIVSQLRGDIHESTSSIPKETESNSFELPFTDRRYESKVKTLRIALAACASLLLVSGIALYNTHGKLESARSQIASLNSEKELLAVSVSHIKQVNNDLQKVADIASNPSWKVVELVSTTKDPNAKMVVYWDTQKQSVIVDQSKIKLPANSSEQQYQLWALVDGKPVDLGVFDSKPDSSMLLINMKGIAVAQTFAVTLEKRGGNPTPTMSQLTVAGNVSI